MSDTLKANIVSLLNAVGNPDRCKGCGERMWWVMMKSGKTMPITEDGGNHFFDCPNAIDEYVGAEAKVKK